MHKFLALKNSHFALWLGSVVCACVCAVCVYTCESSCLKCLPRRNQKPHQGCARNAVQETQLHFRPKERPMERNWPGVECSLGIMYETE